MFVLATVKGGLHEEQLRKVTSRKRRRPFVSSVGKFTAYTEHGFVVLSDEAVIEVIGEHHLGSYVNILEADGTSHEGEGFTKEILADRQPPEGTAHTSVRDYGV